MTKTSKKKTKNNKSYTQINYKLNPKEISILLGKKDKSKINDIVIKILEKTNLKNYMYSKSWSPKISNKTIPLFFIVPHKQMNHNYLKKKYKMDKTLVIFLDVDKDLNNKVTYNFYGKKKKYTKKKTKIFGFIPKTKKQAIIEDSFKPKTGDIILYDTDVYYNVHNLTELNNKKIRKKKNFFLMFIFLKKTEQKSKKK